MKLITKAILDALASNLKKPEAERVPVVKFFGGGAGTWLISEMDEDEIMFGLCDLGMGCPELGYVSLAELKEVRFPPFGLGVERDFESECIFYCADGSQSVNSGADTTDTLHKKPGISGITAFKDVFKSAIHLARGPRLLHRALIDLDVDTQMAFDAGYGIDNDSSAHSDPLTPGPVPARIGNFLTMKM